MKKNKSDKIMEKIIEDLYIKDIEELINLKRYEEAIKFMQKIGLNKKLIKDIINNGKKHHEKNKKK
jgi:hypothetical protein